MDSKLDQKLVEKYPNLYRDRHTSMQETSMCWGFQCGNGWYKIIDEASNKLETLILKEPKETRSFFAASTVKEKYGTLRIYMISQTREMIEIISKALHESEKTCEECSKPGYIRNINNWFFTRCDQCFDKLRESKKSRGVINGTI